MNELRYVARRLHPKRRIFLLSRGRLRRPSSDSAGTDVAGLQRMTRRLYYWLTARRCICRGYPHRIHGGTVQFNGTLHRTDGPCYACDSYGRPL